MTSESSRSEDDVKRNKASADGVITDLRLPTPRAGGHDALAAAQAREAEPVLETRVPRPRPVPVRAAARISTALPHDVERSLAQLAGVDLPDLPSAVTEPEDDVAAPVGADTTAHLDFAKRLLRVAELVTFGAFVLLAVSAVLSARYGDTSLSIEPFPFAAWGLGASTSALALAALGGREELAGRTRRRLLSGLLFAALLVSVTGVVANAGGVGGPAWVLFLPVVLVAGAVGGSAVGLSVGALAAAGVYVAAIVTDPLTSAGVGRLVVVLPALPAAGWSAGALGGVARAAAREALDRRLALEADVRSINAALEKVAEGDLAVVPAAGEHADPVAVSMAVAFADTLTSLRYLLRQMDMVAGQLTDSAVDLAGSAEEEVAAISQQVAAVAETTTTIEQLAATAASIADTAVRVAQFAGSTRRDVDAGVAAVEASTLSMELIARRVSDLDRRADVIREQIGRISSTSAAIDDLSRRTSILAVNASIESARAGEHGQGFANVAAEVGTLASRARAATSRIAAIVTELETEAAATAEASHEGHEAVLVGTELQEDVVSALARIAAMVDRTTMASREITDATRMQRVASDAVVSAMSTVTTAGDRYQAGSLRHADAAARLRDLAADLRGTLGRFRIG
jgi:methyl-accepting chemotaxis protein